jgi:hypothetical protein
MLDFLFDWCKLWCININESKSNIIHFRKPHVLRTNFTFKCGDASLELVDEYRYLGLHLNEHMNFEKTAAHLAAAGTRALGAIRNKIFNVKHVRFHTFSKLFQTCVSPIIDYCSGIWGFKSYKSIQDVQYKAIRYFLGVHKFCPLPALEGDIGWSSCVTRCHLNMIRFWNHLITLSDDRLPHKILSYNIRKRNICNNWYSELSTVTNLVNPEYFSPIDLEYCKQEFDIKQSDYWNNNRYLKVKLRYYNIFKSDICPESYVISNLSKPQRSVYAQFRSGILPLAIETGRFSNISLNDRICTMCNSNDVEDEFHFLCICDKYADLRSKLYHKVQLSYSHFPDLDDIDKFIFLNTDCQILTANFIYDAYQARNNALYLSV